MVDLTDEVLVEKAQNNDSVAMTCILERYKGLVKMQARGFFLSGGDIDDLIQEGMIGLHKAVLDYSNKKGASFKSFALICIRRQIIDAIKQDGRKKNLPLNNYTSINVAYSDGEESSFVYSLEAEGSNPEDIYLEKEANDSFMSKVKEILSPSDYQILEYYLAAYSYGDIAKKVDKTVKQIDNAIQRIKKRITKFIIEVKK